jgi:hypothetical protein
MQPVPFGSSVMLARSEAQRRPDAGSRRLAQLVVIPPQGHRSMKVPFRPSDQEQVIKSYPLDGLLEGWFFRQD